jgi:hypothetical protein
MSDEIKVSEKLENPFEQASDRVKLPVTLTADHDLLPEHVDEIVKHLGHVQINGARLRGLHDLGVAGEQMGILRMLKGGVVVSADSLVQMIGRVEKEMDNPDLKLKEKVELAKTLAYLTNAYIRLSSGAVKMDKDVREVVIAEDKSRRNSFAPGKRINSIPV